MDKLKRGFFYHGQEFFSLGEKNGVQVFSNEKDTEVLVTDKEFNVLFNISAQSNQNLGYMTIENMYL